MDGNPLPQSQPQSVPMPPPRIGSVDVAIRSHIMAGNPPPSARAVANWHQHQVDRYYQQQQQYYQQQQQQPPPPPGPPPAANMYGYQPNSNSNGNLEVTRTMSSPPPTLSGYPSSPGQNMSQGVHVHPYPHTPPVQRHRSAPSLQSPLTSHHYGDTGSGMIPPPSNLMHQNHQYMEGDDVGGYDGQHQPLSFEQWQFIQYQQYQQYLAISSPQGKQNMGSYHSPRPATGPSREALQTQMFAATRAGDVTALDQVGYCFRDE